MNDTPVIIADENIAAVDCFAGFGELHLRAGRDITPESVANADVLLVRSVTRVDERLLAGSTVSFVGSATSGTDHVDTAYLKQRGIRFVHAPGCNAQAVVEYVFCALASLARRRQSDWRNWQVGIVGAGNIGGLLGDRLRALGVDFRIHDPFLTAEHRHGDTLVAFEDVLEADAITLHVPLTKGGPHPTFHQFDRDVIEELAPQTVLINAARGAVVDNAALRDQLRRSGNPWCVLDTWEHEPAIDRELLSRVSIGTPHIAGYSRDGKLRGSAMVCRGLAEHLGAASCPDFDIAEPKELHLESPAGETDIDTLNRILLAAYDIEDDHGHMQAMLTSPEPDAVFDRLRREYPERPEFSRCRIKPPPRGAVRETLDALGFVQSWV